MVYCQGDSGGLIIDKILDNESRVSSGVVLIGVVLIGIVSWGLQCANPNWPGVYIRLGAGALHYTTWCSGGVIHHHMHYLTWGLIVMLER
jgi:secreted trypsin-like serine protease